MIGLAARRLVVAERPSGFALPLGIPFALALLTAPPPVVHAQRRSPALASEALGFSSERVARIGATIRRYVDERKVAGTVTLLMRRGTAIHFEAHGFRDVEKAIPMTTDTIFRIASMSKALTSVAAMILVEEGIVALEHPVSRYVEAFRKTNVALRPPRGSWEGAPISVVPAKREITIRDLLTHTAGLGYGFGAAATEWKAAGIQNWYFADRAEPVAAVVERMAALPFDAQPGEAYVYGYATDVLGVVVERASGRSLDAFITERITKPLKMVDTHFFLPRTKRDRLATVYAAKPGGPIERAPEGPAGQGAYVDGPRQAFSGGAGLLSTASDYARFLSMLANGGALDGVRILGRKTVELMRQNHVGSLYNEGRVGFGLGFEVVEHLGRAGRYGSETAYGWGSAYDSNYWVDPVEDMMGIYLSQLLPNGGLDLQMKFRTLAYAALVK